jgi:manganese oxidase
MAFVGRAWGPRHWAAATSIAIVALTAAIVAVSGAGASGDAAGTVAPQTRTYYIAADTVAWNYAPRGRDLITGRPFDAQADVFVRRGVHRIGATYLKALFREYTDASFRHLKPRPARWAHLGLLGPMIQAQVGDTIRVVFRNNTQLHVGIHPHGVLYAKSSEGALYADGTNGADKADDAVAPGRSHTYVWKVPERAGPGPMDPSSVMWMYHGHTDEVDDQYAGLMGAMIVTRRGMARADGSPKDVDREIAELFMVSDENQSPLLAQNIRRYAADPAHTDHADDGFVESNKMHMINGYVYGNGPMVTLHRGERVRWYVMSMGTEVDLHTPHWHANTVTTASGMRTDVVSLLPAEMMSADMAPDNPGIWLLHCHVGDHILAGMQTRYEVR